MPVTAVALDPLPEVVPGDDLAALIAAGSGAHSITATDVVVVSHKVVSKAEGRTLRLAGITPSARALRLAAELGREDPELVEVVLRESSEIIRAEGGVLISRTHHGFVCANAGVDRSNSGPDADCVLLPADPDASARALRAALPNRPAVVIADSFGRAWRRGECDVAIGIAGLAPLDDRRGGRDRDGRELNVSTIAVADQAAAAADLARGDKAAGRPAVLVSGLQQHITTDDGPGAAALLRAAGEDLFGPRS